MSVSRKFCQMMSNSDSVVFGIVFCLLVEEGRTENLYNTKSGPSSAGLVALSFSRRSGPVMLKEQYSFVIFHWGCPEPLPPPPQDPRMWALYYTGRR